MDPSLSSGHHENRLAYETSPYLLQHARNPVDWFPWGAEAFDKAKAENKPVFLSVGYSACHWCHVMERESFENEEIASLLNQHYVSVKVDREERPDVDQIYMSAVQLITHRGGWPMSVFLTPDGKPFYGGTYWPPFSRMGMPGFRDILLKLSDYWTNKRDEVDDSAERLVEAIQNLAAPEFEEAPLDDAVLRRAAEELLASFDKVHGGFGAAPKFPHPMDLRFLLRAWRRFDMPEALHAATFTLDKMAAGGIYDQLGGGFHRYSTDARWLAPHFEKMLYDNALLVPAYLEAFQATGEPRYATIVRETLDYVLREMTSPEGGFYSAQDADSEGEEGKFFVWTEAEILAALGPDEAKIFGFCYDVTHLGNWEGKTILNLPRPVDESARMLGLEPRDVNEVVQRSRQKLFALRAGRFAPGRDDKILVSWNGMMISAFAQASAVLQEPRYLAAARRAADFILGHVRDAAGRLLHSYNDGRARFQAYLDDYACLIDALIDLFQTSAEERDLHAALEFTDDLIRRFHDPAGGFFFTANDHEELIARTKDFQDQATPSGNGMAVWALVKLARLTGREAFQQLALDTLQTIAGLLHEHPRAAAQSLIALDDLVGPDRQLILIDAGGEADSMWAEVWKRFLPNKVALRWPAQRTPEISLPLLEGRLDSASSRLYVCTGQTCQTPADSVAQAVEQLDQK